MGIMDHLNSQSDRLLEWFIQEKGVSPMSEPEYIKKIYNDINQLGAEQGRRFDRLETNVQEIKAGLGEIRKEIKEEIGDKIKDVKEAFKDRIEPFEKSVDTRFDSLGTLTKLVGGGILVLLVGLLLRLLGWVH
jgi:hypothetical protein